MSEPFIGEIRMMPYSFTPYGWLSCDGGVYSISTYPALASIVSNTYGGNGQTTFAVPDLRGRTPFQPRNASERGQVYGANRVTLTTVEIPSHSHTITATATAATNAEPSSSGSIAQAGSDVYDSNGTTGTALQPFAIGMAGESAAHNNMQPSLGMAFFIAWQGYYPPRS